MSKENPSRPFYKRPRILLAFLLPVLVALVLVFNPFAPAGVKVHYIDVGRPNLVGDSILIETADGKVVLIDGGFQGTGALKYLQSHNIDHIDMVVLSHAHDDHSGGLIDVLNTIPVDVLVHNGQEIDSPTYQEFKRAMINSGVKTRIPKVGEKLRFGKLYFQVLAPRKINPNTVNDNSIVLRMEVGKIVFLFTGDAQGLTEQWMMDTGQPLKADILKIGHHGANTSSTPAFILEVLPEIGIYSVGPGNKYGFPEAETLETMDAVNIPIYGTDNYGTIVVTSDGKTFTLETQFAGSGIED
jgi:competence protein ComEC